VSVTALERIEDGSELFREREEPAIGSRLLIAQSIDEATGGKTSAGDAGGEPGLVDFSKEAGDLVPTGALACFAGIAYEHEKEVQTVAGSIHHAVRSTADHVAEDSQKLKEDGGRVGLGVGSDGADSQPRGTVESGHGQGPRHAPRLAGTGGPTGFVELRWSGGSRMGLLFQPVVWLIFLPVNWLMAKLEQLSGAALQIGKGWERGPWEACAGARYHDSTLLRLRISVEKSLVTPEKVTLYG
jgi:hypothetical protein